MVEQMTAALVRNHTAGVRTASGSTVVATVATANVAIGSVLVAWVSFDNLTLTTPIVSGLSKMAGETNSWAKIASHDAVTASAYSGVRGEMWAIKTTVAWTVATAVTATVDSAVPCMVILMSEFSGVTTAVRGTAGAGIGTTGSPTASTSGAALAAGDLVLGGATFECWNGFGSPDTDTTNGAWSSAYSEIAAGGSSLASVLAGTQYKIVTATGVQTYNPNNVATDAGVVVVALVPTNLAPNAPTLNTPATGTTVDRAVTNRLGFTPSDPDAGDSQSKFDLRYKVVGAGSWTTITQTTPNSFWDAVGGTFTADDHEFQVRTYDSQGLVGPWSPSLFFTAADAPSVPTITAPTNGATIGLTTATVTWSTPNQTDYQLRKMDDVAGAAGTTVYYDSGDVIDSTTRSLTVAFPTNNRWEHVQVRIKYAGLWSTWADCRVQVSFTAPMVPTLTATATSATASIAVVITNPAPTGGAPATSYNDVFVSSPLDPEYRAATLVTPNGTWTWRTPAAGRVYTIRVVAVGSNGTTSTSV